MPAKGFSAEFRCISGCAGGYPLDQVIYRCPRCGDLLEVVHDLAALRQRSAAEWKELFALRWRATDEPWGSGVWGKHEWVAPALDPSHIVTMCRGASPGATHSCLPHTPEPQGSSVDRQRAANSSFHSRALRARSAATSCTTSSNPPQRGQRYSTSSSG